MKILKGITWENKRGYEPLVKGAEIWMKQHPDVQVVWDQLPWYQFEEKILNGLSNGTNEYDLIMFDHPWTGKFEAEGWLKDLTELYDQTYMNDINKRTVDPSFESYALNGQWALPLDAACHVALYRDDVLQKNELPKTWDDVLIWSKDYFKLHNEAGLVMCVEGVLGSCLFLSMMAGLGYPPYIDETSPTANRIAAEKVLENVKQLLEYTPKGSSHWGPWDIYQKMAQNEGGVYSPSLFGYVNYFDVKPNGKNLSFSTVPSFENNKTGKPILGGVGIGIAHNTKNLSDAKDLVEFYASDWVQKDIFIPNFGQPAANVVWNDEQINSKYNNMYKEMNKNMNNAYIRPRYSSFHALELFNGETLQKYWDGKVGIKTTLDNLRAY